MLLALPFLPGGPTGAAAQEPRRIDIYRFILDVDVPESPALVALDRTGVRVLRGSAPKPVAASVAVPVAGSSAGGAAAALDVAPYWLVGGGMRSLSSYRSNSLEGRVERVLTKTLFSLAATSDGESDGVTRLAFGVRSTFHDPHDPVLNSELPELVARELAQHGAAPPGETEEEASGRGVELGPLFAASRREMRRRCCVQVSAGWGMSGVLRGDVASGDSLETIRHTVWAAAQFTLGPRFDVLTTAEARQAFRSDAYGRFGAALQRKSTAADVRAELFYDGGDRHLHPALTTELRPLPRTAAVLVASSAPQVPGGGPPRLRLDVLFRGYLAERQP